MSISIPETELKSSALFAPPQERGCGEEAFINVAMQKKVRNLSKVQPYFSLSLVLCLLVFQIYKFQNGFQCTLQWGHFNLTLH